VRYNAPTEEISTNTSNNKQVPTVRAPLNYSQVLQTPTPTDVQMDIDREGTVPILAKTTTAKVSHKVSHSEHGNNTMWGELDTHKRN